MYSPANTFILSKVKYLHSKAQSFIVICMHFVKSVLLNKTWKSIPRGIDCYKIPFISFSTQNAYSLLEQLAFDTVPFLFLTHLCLAHSVEDAYFLSFSSVCSILI